ncbi:hypothetical protein [Shimia sp.]|uniref:hypothetical protein n=1 Tax=Shimia sp. TaxID=1954381 RepID=UPI0032973BA7
MSQSMTPDTPLAEGEEVLHSLRADRATYVRTNAWLAAFAMGAGMLILWMLDNPYVWTGAIGGLAAVTVRAFYMMSEELSVRWDITNQRVLGPMQRAIRLGEIRTLKTMGSVVQIVTQSGDKHLIKYQASPKDTVSLIRRAKDTGAA